MDESIFASKAAKESSLPSPCRRVHRQLPLSAMKAVALAIGMAVVLFPDMAVGIRSRALVDAPPQTSPRRSRRSGAWSKKSLLGLALAMRPGLPVGAASDGLAHEHDMDPHGPASVEIGPDREVYDPEDAEEMIDMIDGETSVSMFEAPSESRGPEASDQNAPTLPEAEAGADGELHDSDGTEDMFDLSDGEESMPSDAAASESTKTTPTEAPDHDVLRPPRVEIGPDGEVYDSDHAEQLFDLSDASTSTDAVPSKFTKTHAPTSDLDAQPTDDIGADGQEHESTDAEELLHFNGGEASKPKDEPRSEPSHGEASDEAAHRPPIVEIGPDGEVYELEDAEELFGDAPKDLVAIRKMLMQGEPMSRHRAMAALSRMGEAAWPGGRQEMREALQHEDEAGRISALITFESLGTNLEADDISALRRALRDPDQGVQTKALQILRGIGEVAWPGGAAEMRMALKDKAYTASSQRLLAVEALGSLGDRAGPEDVASLSEAMFDRDVAVFWSAAEVLGKMGVAAWPDVSTEMRDFFASDDGDPLVGMSAATAIAYLGAAASSEDVFKVHEVFAGEDDDISWVIAESLGKSSELRKAAWPGGAREMREASTDPDVFVRQAGLAALGFLCELAGPEDVEAVAKALNDGDDGVSRTAARMLGNMGKVAAPALHEAMRLGDVSTIKAAILALGLRGQASTPDDVAALVAAAQDEREEVRDAAKRLLEQLYRLADLEAQEIGKKMHVITGWDKAPEIADRRSATAFKVLVDRCQEVWADGVDGMQQATKDADPVIRTLAIACLGKLGFSAAMEDAAALREGLSDKDLKASWEAAEALSKLGDIGWPGGEADIRSMVGCPRADLRFGALVALAFLNEDIDAADLASIRMGLADANAKVRWAAARLLGLLRSSATPQALVSLRGALEDEDASVRKEASDSLRSMRALADAD